MILFLWIRFSTSAIDMDIVVCLFVAIKKKTHVLFSSIRNKVF